MRLLNTTFLGACLCVLHAVHATEYGVGFGLTIDYGYVRTLQCITRLTDTDERPSVASVYFPNGSIVNIAKIEGTPNYKTTMKAAAHIHTNIAAPLTDSNAIVDSDSCDCYRAWNHVPRRSFKTRYYLMLIYEYFPRATVGMQHYFKIIQSHLPPWMGGSEAQILDTSSQSLADMLRVLKFATEAYLGTEIPNAAISVPFPVGSGRVHSSSLEVRLNAAASTLKLKLFRPFEAMSFLSSEEIEAKKRAITHFRCHPDDEGFVLGIDFNDAALTATIRVPDCSMNSMSYITRGVLHSIELGARKLSSVENWHDVLVSALHDLTKLPMSGVTKRDQINTLILVGDSARDERLHHGLKDVLGDQYDRLIASVRDDGTPARDPQFLGAASAARHNWDKNCYPFPSRDFGCFVPETPWWFGPIVHYRVKEAWEAIRPIREWFRSTAEKARLAAEQEHERMLKDLAKNPLLIGPP